MKADAADFDADYHILGKVDDIAIPSAELKCMYEFRASPDHMTRLQAVLSAYIGTKNYHNFTKGRSATEESAKRYMTEITADEPFIVDGAVS